MHMCCLKYVYLLLFRKTFKFSNIPNFLKLYFAFRIQNSSCTAVKNSVTDKNLSSAFFLFDCSYMVYIKIKAESNPEQNCKGRWVTKLVAQSLATEAL
jgi:hypothetical protein